MKWLKQFLCSWTHGGGHIKRDAQGRLNWQCQKCGRWADPVPLHQEQKMIDRDIAVQASRRNEMKTIQEQNGEVEYVLTSEELRRLSAIEEAAKNLVKVKGRYHTEQAFNQLKELLK